MTDPTSKHAWPLKQYDGNREGYEEYEVDKDAWLIDKGYDKHVRKTDPRTVPRVTTSYEIHAPFADVVAGVAPTAAPQPGCMLMLRAYRPRQPSPPQLLRQQPAEASM